MRIFRFPYGKINHSIKKSQLFVRNITLHYISLTFVAIHPELWYIHIRSEMTLARQLPQPHVVEAPGSPQESLSEEPYLKNLHSYRFSSFFVFPDLYLTRISLKRTFNQKEGLIPRSLLRNKLFQDMEEVIY